MNNLFPQAILAAPIVLGAILYAIKRLCAFDLEVRTSREQQREQYLRARQARQQMQEHGRGVRKVDGRWTSDRFGPGDKASVLDASVDSKALFESIKHMDIDEHNLLVVPAEVHEQLIASTNDSIAKGLLQGLVQGLRQVTAAPWSRSPRTPRPEIPPWVLALLDPQDAERCSWEWAAHLHERINDGEFHEARVDRRRFVRYALLLALTHRARRALSRSR